MRENIDYRFLFEELLKESDRQGKKLAFFSIGEGGIYNKEIFSQLEKDFKGKIFLHQFGSRNHKEISAFFQVIDFGVASVPVHLLGKSGAYSSMREHNVKVLVPTQKRKEKLRDLSSSQEILTMEHQEFSVQNIAKQFILNLNSYPLIPSKETASCNEDLVSYS